METVTDFEKWIREMRSELEQQTIALERLAIAFAGTDIQLIRRDQVARLRILKSRIMEEVQNTKRGESASQSSANTGALFRSGTALIFGSLFMAKMGRKDALDIGSRMAELSLTKNIPFGLVLIAIGKEGLPEDLKIIPVSRFARESTKTEPEVEASWKHDGYLLVTPEQFADLLDKAAWAVLDGSLCLPIAVDELILLIS